MLCWSRAQSSVYMYMDTGTHDFTNINALLGVLLLTIEIWWKNRERLLAKNIKLLWIHADPSHPHTHTHIHRLQQKLSLKVDLIYRHNQEYTLETMKELTHQHLDKQTMITKLVYTVHYDQPLRSCFTSSNVLHTHTHVHTLVLAWL